MKDATPKKRIPPGQQVVAPHKWPIIGERQPAQSEQPWELEVAGLVEKPIVLSVDELRALPQTQFTIDIHCVTRWSKLDASFGGVLISDLFNLVGVQPAARFASFTARSEREHSTSLSVNEVLSHQSFIALDFEEEPLSTDHGGPIRSVVPGKYFYKSVKWLKRIELLESDRLGYWEAETGYHNGADPWREERYMAPTIDRRTAAKLIESKDFSERDLRSINAQKMNLSGLNARASLLRDADFRHANLEAANFADANLSNAHLEFANCKNVIFVRTDLEGANLAGADLRGADLSGASLIGASFCSIDENGQATNGAVIDRITCLPADQIDRLTQPQQQYLTDVLADLR